MFYVFLVLVCVSFQRVATSEFVAGGPARQPATSAAAAPPPPPPPAIRVPVRPEGRGVESEDVDVVVVKMETVEQQRSRQTKDAAITDRTAGEKKTDDYPAGSTDGIYAAAAAAAESSRGGGDDDDVDDGRVTAERVTANPEENGLGGDAVVGLAGGERQRQRQQGEKKEEEEEQGGGQEFPCVATSFGPDANFVVVHANTDAAALFCGDDGSGAAMEGGAAPGGGTESSSCLLQSGRDLGAVVRLRRTGAARRGARAVAEEGGAAARSRAAAGAGSRSSGSLLPGGGSGGGGAAADSCASLTGGIGGAEEKASNGGRKDSVHDGCRRGKDRSSGSDSGKAKSVPAAAVGGGKSLLVSAREGEVQRELFREVAQVCFCVGVYSVRWAGMRAGWERMGGGSRYRRAFHISH